MGSCALCVVHVQPPCLHSCLQSAPCHVIVYIQPPSVSYVVLGKRHLVPPLLVYDAQSSSSCRSPSPRDAVVDADISLSPETCCMLKTASENNYKI